MLFLVEANKPGQSDGLCGVTLYSELSVTKRVMSNRLNASQCKGKIMKKNQVFFLVAAFASFVLSVSLWFLGDPAVAKEQGIFVGLWVPSILALGGYFNG